MTFLQTGKASFIVGGQFGSESKGNAASFMSEHLLCKYDQRFDVITGNMGAQSGHTSIYQDGVKRVQFHLPTASLNPAYAVQPLTYLNAGCILDPLLLLLELSNNPRVASNFFIHPNAAIITDECKEAEGRSDSAQTKIASTRKGVGEALSRKVLRSGQIARDEPRLKQFVRRIDLNKRLRIGQSVLVEVPQGFSLGIDQPFYPHTTSRNCTVAQAASDAGLHPSFVGESMLVLRTKPIRVGNIERDPRSLGVDVNNINPDGSDYHILDSLKDNPLGHSGGAYPGQRELSWAELGQTPEITTVTKRVRRVFEFSHQQLFEAMSSARPSIVFLAFCDYLQPGQEEDYTRAIYQAARAIDLQTPQVFYAYGPSTSDVQGHPRVHTSPMPGVDFEA